MTMSQCAQAPRLFLQELVTNKPLREQMLRQSIISIGEGFRSQLFGGIIRNLPFLEKGSLSSMS
jgi:hypothetical protein